MRLRRTRRLLCLMVLVPAAIGASSSTKAGKPCGDLCVFIKTALKERPAAYAKFKGVRLNGDEKETIFGGTYKPSDDAECQLITKSQNDAAEYHCYFGKKPGEGVRWSGAFPFEKGPGRKKHAELVQALKAALPDSWKFKDVAGKSVFGADYSTIATQAATHARVAAVLAFMGDENDDATAEVSIRFR